MVVLTVKAGKKKTAIAVLLLIVAIGGLFGIRALSGYIKNKEAEELRYAGATLEERLLFLQGFGIEAEEEEKEKTIRIPAEFNEEYESYNELQKMCGMDLSSYKGKEAVEYSYSLPNENACARLIVVEGRIVGGDICTEDDGGEVRSLNEAGFAETMLPASDDPAWPTD